MSILIAGPDAALHRLGEPFERAAMYVDRCETPAEARAFLLDLSRHYELVFLCSSWKNETHRDLPALVNAHRACLAYTQLAPTEELAGSHVEVTSEGSEQCLSLDPTDVERWRNVLTFAKRAPDEYPALRDALGVSMNLFQYHAPVKRSA
jgi:hypothetical protein